MADEPTHESGLESVIYLVIDCDGPMRIDQIEALLRHPDAAYLPTRGEIQTAVLGLIARGLLVDGYDAKVKNSEHILRIPDPQSTPTPRGLFE